MKFFITAIVAALFTYSADAATCSASTLKVLLTDRYTTQCSSVSGYTFTSGKKPTATQAKALCKATVCKSLFADVRAKKLAECQIPLGDKIYLNADLVNYVPKFC